jgi:hypothetical protein
MEIEAAFLRKVENDLPLVQFGDVVVQFLFASDEGPDVVAIAAGVVSEERDGVASLGREIIERADQAFAFAILPGGIAVLPIRFVGFVFMQRRLGRFARARRGVGF